MQSLVLTNNSAKSVKQKCLLPALNICISSASEQAAHTLQHCNHLHALRLVSLTSTEQKLWQVVLAKLSSILMFPLSGFPAPHKVCSLAINLSLLMFCSELSPVCLPCYKTLLLWSYTNCNDP